MTKSEKVKKLSRAQRRRREDILEASLMIFDRDGFEAAKMSDIAEEAEVAKGTLYLYFDSKAALLQGVIENAIVPTLRAAGEATNEHVGPSAQLLERQLRIMAIRMASREMRILLRFMLSGNSEHHQKVTSFYFENVIQPGISLLRETLQQGVKNGEFRKELGSIDPLVLLGSQIYTTVWKILFNDSSPIDVDQLNRDLVDIFLHGSVLHR